MYHGNKSEREEIRQKHMPVSKSKDLSFPIVVTSFEICIIDRSHLQRFNWQYLILDEGHRIKNRNCRLVRELKQIPSISRLLLSGTPIQNTLEELWSLLNFCAPMIFDDLRVFQAWFGFRNIGTETSVEDIIGNEQQDRIVTKLHEILRPFLLRRLKRDVMIKIPPKVEVVVYCHMSSLQRDYYVHVLQGTIRETLLDIGVEKAKELSQDNMMMNLRKVS
jgi:ATP-dependent DNA helicase